MKKITNQELLPKFLKVSEEACKSSVNDHLHNPLKQNEIVRVHPEQLPHKDCRLSVEIFRRNFVRVLRKDDNGEWKINMSFKWSDFEKISKK